MQQESSTHNVGDPFVIIAIDVVGPFPRIQKRIRIILVACEWTERTVASGVRLALPNQEACTVVEALVDNMFTPFGVSLETKEI